MITDLQSRPRQGVVKPDPVLYRVILDTTLRVGWRNYRRWRRLAALDPTDVLARRYRDEERGRLMGVLLARRVARRCAR